MGLFSNLIQINFFRAHFLKCTVLVSCNIKLANSKLPSRCLYINGFSAAMVTISKCKSRSPEFVSFLDVCLFILIPLLLLLFLVLVLILALARSLVTYVFRLHALFRKLMKPMLQNWIYSLI